MENVNWLKLSMVVVALAMIVHGLAGIIFKFESDSLYSSLVIGSIVGVAVVTLLGLVKKGRCKFLLNEKK